MSEFVVTEEVYRSRSRVVYRGRRLADDAPVILKTSLEADPSRRATASLVREYDILRELHIDGVARAHGLLPHDGNLALVLEDAGGERLKTLLAGGALDVGTFLEVSIQIATIVAALHERHIIHKDLNPKNILVDVVPRPGAGGGDDGPRPGAGAGAAARRRAAARHEPPAWRVTLIDFGISSRLPSERRHLSHPSVLEGTLAYMSPEQTGRMNRDLDYRSDFYSLGVTFYEMLTGRLPFDSADPLEVVHHHIAKTPPAPSALDASIPAPLSGIVMKLLAKIPEERYQSAAGLRADLEACRREWLATGRIAGLVPGQLDASDRFVVSQRLYGREAEAAQLMQAFERVCGGGQELLLVSGYSGIGKTSLIHEIHTALAHRQGCFVSGKFDQLSRNVPYSAISQALSALARQLLTEDEAALEAWRRAILGALGPNAPVVLDLVPEFQLILGPQPPVPALGAAESKNRFQLCFQELLGVLATPARPLVLFLDDLQWADSASLDLLRSFMTGGGRGHLLLLGAYRDNEVGEAHPLRRFEADLVQSGARLSRMALGPLSADDLAHLLGDTLRSDAGRVHPLAELVQRKTEGNPFFVTQFLKALHQQGLLGFDAEARRWGWDLGRIRAAASTDNVVELVVSRIQRLPPATQEVLQLAACIGNRFDLHTLTTIRDRSWQATAGELWDAVAHELVVPLSGDFDPAAWRTPAMAPAAAPAVHFKFLHDRVQQAAYVLIPDEDKRQVHLRIGRLMLAHADPAAVEESVFDLVQHLNFGADLITDAAERARLAELDGLAGRKAKASTAYAAALGYFETARKLLPADAWESAYATTFGLGMEIAECEYLTGRFDDAETTFAMLLERARTPLDRAAVHRLRVVQYENLARYTDAVAAAKQGLHLFGIELPADAGLQRAAFEAEMAAIQRLLGPRAIADLATLPALGDPEVKMCMRLLMTAWAPAYIAADRGLIALLPALMVRLSLEHGNTEESACGYVVHGITVGTLLGDFASGHEFGRLALEVNDRFHDLEWRAKVHHLFSCFVNLWRRPLRTCFPHSKEAVRAGLESGDFAYACYGIFHESWYGLLTSRDLGRFQQDYASNVAFLERIEMRSFAELQQVILHWGLALQGRTERPGALSSPAFDAEKYARTWAGVAFFETFFYVVQLMVARAFEQYEAARAAAEKAEQVVYALAGTIWPVLLDFHHALVLAELLPGRDEAGRRADLDKLAAIEARLHTWAENAPENFRHLHLLVAAERARLEGRAAAIDLYEAALQAARQGDLAGDAALAALLYGRFWLRRGQPDVAAAFLGRARDDYARWGAAGVAEDLERRHPDLLPARRRSAPPGVGPGTSISLTTSNTPAGALDDFSMTKAAQVISSEIELENLLARLMTIVVENAGAERGMLLLEGPGGPLLQAAGSVGGAPVEVLQARPLDAGLDLCAGVVHFVRRTRDSVVVADAAGDSPYAADPDVVRRRPRSILCTPVLHQGELIGVLYLENNLVPGAFTPERLEVVRTLASQAAIAIRNAELFREVTALRDRLQAENVYLQEEIKTQTGFEDIVGKSPALRKVLRQVEQVAPTDSTVLLLGETGTGKELIARAIHAHGRRQARPLVAVNCGAISAGLVESELFGHEKGAFTGAVARKIGRFELADGGTLFLDEIGELPLDLQVKLLRVLQEGEIERLGGTRTLRVDVRVIAATNRDLAKQVQEGRFREDLYYRLNVFPIQVPPLRERREDILPLVRHFVLHFGNTMGKKIESIPRPTLDALLAYAWPGNVRELRNIVERSVIVSKGTALELGDWIGARRDAGAAGGALALHDVERAHVLQVLEQCGWRVSGRGGAAEVLGLKPTTLEARMKKLGIQRPS